MIPDNRPRKDSQKLEAENTQEENAGPRAGSRISASLTPEQVDRKEMARMLYELSMDYQTGNGVDKDWEVANQILHRAAWCGSEEAAQLLAEKALCSVYDDPCDISFELIEALADRGNAPCQYVLGRLQYDSWSIDTTRTASDELKRALGLLTKAADQNHSDAQVDLGRILLFEQPCVRDESRGMRYLVQAAESGNLEAAETLGFFLNSYGQPPERLKLASHYLRMAADRGSRSALVELAITRESGWAFPRGDSDSLSILRREAKNKYPPAMRAHGLAIEHGLGLPADKRAAFNGYLKAAIDHDLASQVDVAGAYLHGQHGLPRDVTQALRWYTAAASQGHTQSMYILARLHLGSHETTREPKRAIGLLISAAKAGHSEAQVLLAGIFIEGKYVKENKFAAARWLRAAAEQCHPKAEFALARMYLSGEGVARDPEKAQALFARAASHGHQDA